MRQAANGRLFKKREDVMCWRLQSKCQVQLPANVCGLGVLRQPHSTQQRSGRLERLALGEMMVPRCLLRRSASVSSTWASAGTCGAVCLQPLLEELHQLTSAWASPASNPTFDGHAPPHSLAVPPQRRLREAVQVEQDPHDTASREDDAEQDQPPQLRRGHLRRKAESLVEPGPCPREQGGLLQFHARKVTT